MFIIAWFIKQTKLTISRKQKKRLYLFQWNTKEQFSQSGVQGTLKVLKTPGVFMSKLNSLYY